MKQFPSIRAPPQILIQSIVRCSPKQNKNYERRYRNALGEPVNRQNPLFLHAGFCFAIAKNEQNQAKSHSGYGFLYAVFHISSNFVTDPCCRSWSRFGSMGRYQSFRGLRTG